MKYAVKTKAEQTEVYTIRIPTSLKQRMDATRKRADERGVDYNATLIGVLDEFDADLQTRLGKPQSKGTGVSVNGVADGSSLKAEVR